MKYFPSHLPTCESVTKEHPDKVANAISDAVLDAMKTFVDPTHKFVVAGR